LFIHCRRTNLYGWSSSTNCSAEEDSAAYVTSQQIEKGKAPGMHVQLLSENHGRKEYAVIFSKGDEAFSGLNEFAEKSCDERSFHGDWRLARSDARLVFT